MFAQSTLDYHWSYKIFISLKWHSKMRTLVSFLIIDVIRTSGASVMLKGCAEKNQEAICLIHINVTVLSF